MLKKTNLSNEYKCNKKNEQCSCNDNNVSYKIIENYRSILDRKQQLISSWKTLNRNGRVSFTHGTQYRKDTDVLVLRLKHICLINPWYKYINVDKYLPLILKQNQCYKIFEIVLLECNCLTDLHEYELAIIECPCVEQWRTYCTYCRLIITAIEQSNQLLEGINQQTNISFSLDVFNTDKDNSLSRLESCRYQHTVQNQVKSEEVLHAISSEIKSDTHVDENIVEKQRKYIDQETQTKLFAILLPQCPLSEMKPGKIDARTSINITQACQVNTLSYLIKMDDSETDLQNSKENQSEDIQQMNHLTSTLLFHIKTRLVKVLLSEENDCQYDKQEINIPTIQFERNELLDDDVEEEKINSTLMKKDQTNEFFLTLSPLKCINAFNTVDLDEPNTSVASSTFDENIISTQILSDIHTINLEHIDVQHKTYNKSCNNSNIHILQSSNSNNNNSEKLTSDHLLPSNYQITRLYRLITRKRRQNRNKKRIYGFLQRLYLHKKSNTIQLFSSKQQSESHLPSTSIPTIKDNLSFNQRQQSIINLNLNNFDPIPQYKAYDHAIIIRTSKYSTTCKQLQTLLNNPDTILEEFIDLQLQLTCNNNCKSVCILIDDHKKSEQFRFSFLHYIYTTLSNTLKKILHQKSIEITCMNLAFFNNSICDIINMQRLRLIDTGKKIFLLPSCEIPLKTSNDITIAINRLSTKMSFAHQILIINFSHSQSLSLSGSFFFLQLAPICSIKSTGLFTNLNSTTYSVLNLIRQLNTGQLFKHNKFKRYLLNDCLLNRLLKTYLFSSQQTMNVITIKQENFKKDIEK